MIPMKASLLNFVMHDGSRQFSELAESCGWDDFRRHIESLPGATITNYLTDHVTEMWLDFTFLGHYFTVNNQQGNFCFFVRAPACPDDILTAVIEHCESLLNSRRT